jgi:predicted HicB family RNase H-like nuclease
MAEPQLHIRIPKDLRTELDAEAKRQGVSLNNLIITLLAGATGWRKP